MVLASAGDIRIVVANHSNSNDLATLYEHVPQESNLSSLINFNKAITDNFLNIEMFRRTYQTTNI